MSLGNDYLKLIDAIFEIDEIDMWISKPHWSIAYLLNKLYNTEKYEEIYNNWLQMALKKDYNNLCWDIINYTVDICEDDESISSDEKEYHKKIREILKEPFQKNTLAVFGIISEEYVPNWFWGLFKSYMISKEYNRKKIIIDYFLRDLRMNEKRAKEAYSKLERHSDILNEFYIYVKNNDFKAFYPITSEGISAKQLHDTTYLSPLGAYNYLIYLRESPKEALEDLRKGLPRK